MVWNTADQLHGHSAANGRSHGREKEIILFTRPPPQHPVTAPFVRQSQALPVIKSAGLAAKYHYKDLALRHKRVGEGKQKG